jgi:hypothetical protein
MRTSIGTNRITMTKNVPNWRNHKYHPKSCEELEKLHDWFAENIKAAYVDADDKEGLKIRLEKIEVSRQVRLKNEKKRVHKAQLKAEREADPVKMKKYLEKMENFREWLENKN